MLNKQIRQTANRKDRVQWRGCTCQPQPHSEALCITALARHSLQRCSESAVLPASTKDSVLWNISWRDEGSLSNSQDTCHPGLPGPTARALNGDSVSECPFVHSWTAGTPYYCRTNLGKICHVEICALEMKLSPLAGCVSLIMGYQADSQGDSNLRQPVPCPRHPCNQEVPHTHFLLLEGALPTACSVCKDPPGSVGGKCQIRKNILKWAPEGEK